MSLIKAWGSAVHIDPAPAPGRVKPGVQERLYCAPGASGTAGLADRRLDKPGAPKPLKCAFERGGSRRGFSFIL